MSTATPTAEPAPTGHLRLKRLLVGALAIVVIGAAANLLGWDISGWCKQVWDTMTTISPAYLVGGIALYTVQTSATAFAWYSILRWAYPDGGVRCLEILASYAASVALNCIVPANLGTLVLLLMFTTIIAGATFAGILGAYAVEKIFFILSGTFTYLYLFLTVGGSFDIKFEFVKSHPWATAVLLVGAGVLIYLLARRLWGRIVKWWDEAKEGGQILAHPGPYFGRVFLPEFVSWVAYLGMMAVFLAAYDIPVSFNTLMRIAGGNSIANVTSVTPGGAGVNQAFNVASLNGVTDSQTATAYSVAQQLITTAWSIVLAIGLMTWAFGWTSSKQLVGQSYGEAKIKAAEQKAAHRAKQEAKKAAKREAKQGVESTPGATQPPLDTSG
jgi:uncharacterized membrane protein YbhN (UPF0104 family)